MRSVFIFLLFFLLPFAFASAQSVDTFIAFPNSISSGAQVDFSWILSNAGGYSFIVSCSPGIQLTGVSCDTAQSSTAKTNDLIRVNIVNVSGGTKTVNARVIPKDAAGQDYISGAKDVTVTVATRLQPIISFVSSATSTVSGQSLTLSWSSIEVPGVNLQIECRNEITVTSPSYAGFLPCGTAVFASALSPNSSLALNFKNTSIQAIPYKLTLLPAIIQGSYDGTHAANLSVSVASDILPDPNITSFTSSSSIISGQALVVSWSIDKALGANIKISCVSGLTASSTENPTSSLPCDTYAFDTPLQTTGSLTLYFQNSIGTNADIKLTLVPLRQGGGYDGVRSKSLNITVRPPGTVSLSPPASLPPSSSPLPPSPLPPPIFSPPSSSPKIIKTIFTQSLYRGSRGPQVTILQEFFRKDSQLYPEGIVSGYFGPATERAVKRFQKKYSLASEGVPGYGYVGPKTKAKLNAFQ